MKYTAEQLEERAAEREERAEAREERAAGYLQKIGDKIDIDLIYNFPIDGVSNWNEFYSEIQDKIQDIIFESSEVIYYSNAIEFLSKNDPSLKTSLELAEELGYAVKDLNSELLATLLSANIMRDDWAGVQNEVEEFFAELQQEQEQDDDEAEADEEQEEDEEN